MEGINMFLKKQQHQQPSYNLSSPTSPPLSLHKDSQTISKTKPPKIRIIHIFAPEIIKTDVENFRELVQRLTGKPTDKVLSKKKAPKIMSSSRGHPKSRTLCEHQVVYSKKLELRNGFGSCLGPRETPSEWVKEEEEEEEEDVVMWNGASSGGFLSGFSEMDGLIQGLGEFPLIPMAMEANHYLQLHGFEESQLA